MTSTMFERYGGFAGIRGVVTAFYDKALASEILAPYFRHSDMSRLIDHQTKLVAALMGGPRSYSDDALRAAHAHLAITRGAFDEMAALFVETLEDCAVAEADIATLRDEIVRRKPLITTD